MSDLDPLCILLVTSGTRGDRLLFRYPYGAEDSKASTQAPGVTEKKNPYALKKAAGKTRGGHRPVGIPVPGSGSSLNSFSDLMITNLLAVKNLCDQKFDVMIDDVRFVGFPASLHNPAKQSQSGHMIITVNVVFPLRATAPQSVIDSYQDMAKQLTAALRYEETRCNYLSQQAKQMLSVHDEIATFPEDQTDSPYSLILDRQNLLGRELKQVYEDIVSSGIVKLCVNQWVEVNFCLPHKIHVVPAGDGMIHLDPKVLKQCLANLRPYHSFLLMQEPAAVLSSLPMDCTPTLTRLISVNTPLKSLQTLALDADISLAQVFRLVSHLVYWAKATIIYPLCETNIYVLSPQANIYQGSPLVEEFTAAFPGYSLHVELAEFSLPSQLQGSRDKVAYHNRQNLRLQMVVWMLQRRLLIQLHTYINLVAPRSAPRIKRASTDLFTSTGLTAENLAVLEDGGGGLHRHSSVSDLASVNSDESFSAATYASQLSKSPSLEMSLDGPTTSEDRKMQWRVQESALARLERDEKMAVLKCPGAKNPEDLRLFGRLVPYLNGTRHLEEIMYQENLQRAQLLTLLDRFKDTLITCCHPDPATTFYKL